MDYNQQTQQVYYENQAPVAQPKPSNGCAIAALILGIIGFGCNPAYLVSIAGIILGGVGIGLSSTQGRKSMAIWGLSLSIAALVVQFVADIILSFFTFGLSFLV